jgi:hypothetical protein
MRTPFLFVLLGLLTIRCVAAEEVAAKVSVATVTLEITILHDDKGNPILREEFRSNDPGKYGVYCMSGFHDAQYMLRDSAGRVVAVNKEPWKYGSDIIMGGGGIPSGSGLRPAGDPCKTVKAPIADRQFPLSYLYPNLEPGRYTLQVTLSPTGSGEYATTPPFEVIIH